MTLVIFSVFLVRKKKFIRFHMKRNTKNNKQERKRKKTTKQTDDFFFFFSRRKHFTPVLEDSYSFARKAACSCSSSSDQVFFPGGDFRND